MTTKGTIKSWYERGENKGYTHMAVYWDCFDGDDGDYPVYITAEDEDAAREKIKSVRDRLMEVYSYAVPLKDQIDLSRAFNYTTKT